MSNSNVEDFVVDSIDHEYVKDLVNVVDVDDRDDYDDDDVVDVHNHHLHYPMFHNKLIVDVDHERREK